MAAIWKRKDRDTWVVDYRDAAGRRRRLTVHSRKEAEDSLSEKIKESRDESRSGDAEITLAEYASRWLNLARAELASRTLHRYEQLFNLHINLRLGHL